MFTLTPEQTAARVYDWLREGYGVEDAAVLMAIPVDQVRAIVAADREAGTLVDKICFLPAVRGGNYIRCQHGHKLDHKFFRNRRNGKRYCRACADLLAQRVRRNREFSESMGGFS